MLAVSVWASPVTAPDPAGQASSGPLRIDQLAAGPAVAWSQVVLPGSVDPLTITPLGDHVLAGVSVSVLGAGGLPAPVSPQMMLLANDGTITRVPLAPHSPYAFQAAWTSVVTQGERILAIGGARGGAHGNVRWTVWRGTGAGVEEYPQEFSVFGGWGAGDLVSAVITPDGEALLGTWGGAQAGLDAAVWLPTGDDWARQDPAGTALESTRQLLVGARTAVGAGRGILLVGSMIRLGQASVNQLAAVWRSTAGNVGWRRVELPDAGRRSEALAAACDGARCTVVGQVDGLLARWRLDGDAAVRDLSLPRVLSPESDPVAAPLRIGGRDVQLASDRGRLVALTDRDGVWVRSSGPPGWPLAGALVGDSLYVLMRTGPDGAATVWRTDAHDWR